MKPKVEEEACLREKINYLGDLHFENGLEKKKIAKVVVMVKCLEDSEGVVGYVKKMGKFVRSKEED